MAKPYRFQKMKSPAEVREESVEILEDFAKIRVCNLMKYSRALAVNADLALIDLLYCQATERTLVEQFDSRQAEALIVELFSESDVTVEHVIAGDYIPDALAVES